MNELYAEMEPLFAADPNLLHMFIAMCPEEDYLCLFRLIPAYLTLVVVSRQPKKVQYVNKEEVVILSIGCVIITYYNYSCVVLC